jgi:hypothetical protein
MGRTRAGTVRVRGLLLGLVAASVLLGALAGPAAARNLSISTQQLRSQFREVTWRLPFFNTKCQVTMEGSYHRSTIAKVQGSLVGYITATKLGPCSTGSATVLTETLPWHLRYLAFAGSLPNITNLIVASIGPSFRVREPFGIACLSRSTAEEPVILFATRDVATGVLTSAELGGAIRTGEECFNEVGTFTSDRGTVSVLGASTRITVRLI